MPAFTAQQARQYYNSIPQSDKDAIAQSGADANNDEWLLQWFTNAVNAGVPSAVMAAGGKSGTDDNVNVENENGDAGATLPWADAAEPEEWIGKRSPTPSELRKWASYQHQDYLSGNQNAQDEDYARFSDRVLADLIKKTWDPNKGGWKPNGGNPWASYDDSGKMLEGPGGQKPGAGQGGAGAPAQPAKPVTYTEGDKQLSYTGNPLVDNMINMFNQAQSQRAAVGAGVNVDRGDLGAFARGENQQVGGGDDLSKLAGMLMGTGNNAFLWTAVDDDAFGGLKGQWSGEAAKKKKKGNVAGPSVADIADPIPPPAADTAQQIVEPDGPKIPTYKQDQIDNGFNYKKEYFGEEDSPLSRMLGDRMHR